MENLRNDLQSFNMAKLNEIRNLRAGMFCGGGGNKIFWDELELILRSENYSESKEWRKREKDDIILGDVWYQPIGVFYYKNTIHKYEYLYIETTGLAIAEHGHEQIVHDGKQVRKIKEWYVFPDAKMSMCGKGEKHQLVNNFGKPIYVLSVKIAHSFK